MDEVEVLYVPQLIKYKGFQVNNLSILFFFPLLIVILQYRCHLQVRFGHYSFLHCIN